MAICDTTFCELKVKDVINICNCKKLGRICDIVIDLKCGKIKGIILPGCKRFNIFKPPEDIFIPWKNILRIGNDVILIEDVRRLRDCNDKCDKQCDDDKDCDCEEIFDKKLHPKLSKYFDDDEDDND